MSTTLLSSFPGHRTVWFLGLVVTLLLSPVMLSAGVIFIPIGGFTGENAQGDRLSVRIQGEGPDLTSMTGQARFRDGATNQMTTVAIADTTTVSGSSVLILKDAVGTAVVEIDLTGVSLTWLTTNTTFKSGVDLVKMRLSTRSRTIR